MTLTFSFFNEIKNAEIPAWPGIVLKHKISPSDLKEAGQLIKNGHLYDCWINSLCKECFNIGILKAEIVFDKYEIQEGERETVKEELRRRFFDKDRSWINRIC